jgi:hypothetical protein
MPPLLRTMRRIVSTLVFAGILAIPGSGWAQTREVEAKPSDPFFAKFSPRKAALPAGLIWLQPPLRATAHYAVCP